MKLFMLTFVLLTAAIAGDGGDTAPRFPVCPQNCGVTFNKKAPMAPKSETQKAPRRLGR